MSPARIESARFNQRLDGRPIASRRFNPLAKIKQILIGTILFAFEHDGFRCPAAATFYRGQCKKDLVIANGEVHIRRVHIGRNDFDLHPCAVFKVLDKLVFVLEVATRNIARKQRSQSSSGNAP